MGPPDPLPGVEVRPGVLHLAHVQPVGPVVVEGVDVVGRADHPHAGIDGRLEQFAGLRVVAVEPARLLGHDHVPPLGLDPGPDLIDPGAVGDLAAHFGLLDDVDGHVLGLGALGQIGLDEPLAGGDLVVDARLPLLLGREPGVDQDAEGSALGQGDGLAKVHHRAPPFRPSARLAFLAVFVSPARRPRLVVPDFAPGGLAFCGFPREPLGLLAPCRGSPRLRSSPAPARRRSVPDPLAVTPARRIARPA